MPKMPVTASIAASRPMTPSATVAARAGNSTSSSASGQLCSVIGTFGSMPLSVRCSAAAISFGASRDRTTKTASLCSLCDNGRYTAGCGDSCQVVVLAVLRHAHHFRQLAPQNEALSDRRRFAPHLPREGFVHDRHVRRLCGVLP